MTPSACLKPRGLRAALACLTQARYGIAWGAIGAARSCYRCALEYAKSRKQFSRQLAGYQLVQNKLVTMLTEITKAQMVCLRLAHLKDQGKMRQEQVSFAKRNNVGARRWRSRGWRATCSAPTVSSTSTR